LVLADTATTAIYFSLGLAIFGAATGEAPLPAP
jgi:hypothetical protein